MENNKKPDWFELADNDQPAKRNLKPAKGVLAVTATLALTTLAGWGFMSNDESKAIASESTSQVTAAATPQKTTPPLANPSATSNSIIKPPTSKSREGEHEFGNDD